MRISVDDCTLLNLPKIGEREGMLTSISQNADIPFPFKRIFYLYDIPNGESRGAHAHKECHQLLIALSGSFSVILDDGKTKKTFFLKSPSEGLHIPPGIWASENDFSSGSVCVVLASHLYSEEDYIRDYQKYLDFLKND